MSEVKLTPLRLEVLRAIAGRGLRLYDRFARATTRMGGRDVSQQCRWLSQAGLIKVDWASRSGFHVPWIVTPAGEDHVQRGGPWHE